MTNLKEMEIAQFCGVLGSDAPTPGGGAATGLIGAVGAALTAMVCSLTLGREKYAAWQESAGEALERIKELQARYLDAMERDALTYHKVSDAYKLPKSTPEEQAARAAAIQRGLEGCTVPPFEMMELAVEALELTRSLVGKSNPTAVSDLGVAALALGAAVQAGWLNVLVNIGMLKNRDLAEDYRKRGEALLDRALPVAREIYEDVAKALGA